MMSARPKFYRIYLRTCVERSNKLASTAPTIGINTTTRSTSIGRGWRFRPTKGPGFGTTSIAKRSAISATRVCGGFKKVGPKEWEHKTVYPPWWLAETTGLRLKTILGDWLQTRHLEFQIEEMFLKSPILSQMMHL